MTQKYGALANQEVFDRERPCVVCDDRRPRFSWTDYSGEGYCVRCGTPYQLKWGQLKEGESYPRLNVKSEWIPILKEFYRETKSTNGCGNFVIWRDYPDQYEGRKRFNAWLEEKHPELLTGEQETDDEQTNPH